jgi:hypothetical protein
MRILTKRKLWWILGEVKKGELSVYQIAKQQKVSSRWVRKLAKKYGSIPVSKIKTGVCGRPPKQISDEDKNEVLEIHAKIPMCAVKIERFLSIKGAKHIPHNRIHRILLEAGKVKVMEKKIRRKNGSGTKDGTATACGTLISVRLKANKSSPTLMTHQGT